MAEYSSTHYLNTDAASSPAPATIFIKGLPSHLVNQELFAQVEPHQQYIRSIRIPRRPDGSCRGFSYIDCESRKAGRRIIKLLDGSTAFGQYRVRAQFSDPLVKLTHEPNVLFLSQFMPISNTAETSRNIRRAMLDAGIPMQNIVAIRYGTKRPPTIAYVEFNNDEDVKAILTSSTILIGNEHIACSRSVPLITHSKPPPAAVDPRSVTILNIPSSLDSERIISAMQSAGTITAHSTRVVNDKYTMNITFENDMEANFALSSFPGIDIDGYEIEIKPCQTRKIKIPVEPKNPLHNPTVNKEQVNITPYPATTSYPEASPYPDTSHIQARRKPCITLSGDPGSTIVRKIPRNETKFNSNYLNEQDLKGHSIMLKGFTNLYENGKINDIIHEFQGIVKIRGRKQQFIIITVPHAEALQEISNSLKQMISSDSMDVIQCTRPD